MNWILSGYLLAILNATSTFDRVIPGVLADKYGRLNMFGIGAIATGVVIFRMNSVTTNAMLILYAITFRFVSGIIIKGASATFSLCPKDAGDVGMYLSIGLSISALGGLICPPVDGGFVNHYYSFFEVFLFSGVMCLFGGFISAMAKFINPRLFRKD